MRRLLCDVEDVLGFRNHASSLELGKIHNTAILARLLSSKNKQVRVQNIVHSNTEDPLVFLSHGVDKGSSQTRVAAAMIATVQLGSMVLRRSGEKVKDILDDISVGYKASGGGDTYKGCHVTNELSLGALDTCATLTY